MLLIRNNIKLYLYSVGSALKSKKFKVKAHWGANPVQVADLTLGIRYIIKISYNSCNVTLPE